MDEHSHSFEGHSPVSAASLSAFAQRFLVETLKSSGHEQWARWIKEWPEILGDKTGRALKNMLDKQTKGEAITPEEKHEFERALEEEPKEAATLLGLLIADVLHGTVDATEERKQILKLFNLAFDIICGYMRTATTSLALKGFIHNEKCISYWHLEEEQGAPQFVLGGEADFLFPVGLKVYLRYEEPTPDRLAQLNEEIRRAPDRHLPLTYYLFNNTPDIAQVDSVHETKIATTRLHPDHEKLSKEKKPEVFHGVTLVPDYSKPVRCEEAIPVGAPALPELVGSLFDAKRVQLSHVVKVQRTIRDVMSQRDKAS